MAFVHLRTHTEYSVVDGTLRIDDAASAAAKDGQVALGLTDLANMFGGVKFYNACRKKGVKPVLGAEVWLEPDATDKPPSRVLLLVQNFQGYLNLSELLSRAWIQNVQRNQALLKLEWMQELHEGLICLGGMQFGPVGQALIAGDEAKALDWARRLARSTRAASTSSCSAPGCPARRRCCANWFRWPPRRSCRWWRRIPSSS